jgi:hypothetical protein
MLAAVPDYVWLPVVAVLYAVVEVLKAVALRIAARKVETAADRVEAKLTDVHTLVNSQRGATLKALAVALRATASHRPTPETLAAADAAEKESQEHDARQARVDAEEKPDAPG